MEINFDIARRAITTVHVNNKGLDKWRKPDTAGMLKCKSDATQFIDHNCFLYGIYALLKKQKLVRDI